MKKVVLLIICLIGTSFALTNDNLKDEPLVINKKFVINKIIFNKNFFKDKLDYSVNIKTDKKDLSKYAFVKFKLETRNRMKIARLLVLLNRLYMNNPYCNVKTDNLYKKGNVFILEENYECKLIPRNIFFNLKIEGTLYSQNFYPGLIKNKKINNFYKKFK